MHAQHQDFFSFHWWTYSPTCAPEDAFSRQSFKSLVRSGDVVLIDGPERYMLEQMQEVTLIFRHIVPFLEDLVKSSFHQCIFNKDWERMGNIRFLIFSEFARQVIRGMFHQRSSQLHNFYVLHDRICEKELKVMNDWAIWFNTIDVHFDPCTLPFRKEFLSHYKKLRSLVDAEVTIA